MVSLVDLTNLRSMTDGNREVEAILFTEFNHSFAEGIDTLTHALEADAQEKWRTHAHSLKGISLNLGAESLSALCKQAQEDYQASTEEKRALLVQIEQTFEAVRAFLDAEIRQ